MSRQLHIAIVGHTNTGKTSFLRSFLHQTGFGEVENRAGTTRHVEAVSVSVAGNVSVTFYDTPGMEDAPAILDYFEAQPSGLRENKQELIRQFLLSKSQQSVFDQEMKVLRQILKSDLCIYVIDAREPVFGKYQDELQLLSMCAKPILPLLNFTAQENQSIHWYDALRRLNLHVVADFDTVMYNQDHELLFLQQLKSLLSEHAQTVQSLIEARAREWQHNIAVAKKMVAEYLIDIAAWKERVHRGDESQQRLDDYRNTVRDLESKALTRLLAVFQFTPEILEYTPLAFSNMQWKDDAFDSQTWALYGIDVGSAVVKGGALGFTLDLLTGGLSMGLGTTLGASAGLLLRKGRDWKHKVQGYSTWRLDNTSLKIFLARQQVLLRTLSSRRHANMDISRIEDYDFNASLPTMLKRARFKSYWSRLNDDFRAHSASRNAAIAELIQEL